MYEFSYMAINRNLDDLTHEDSVFIPEPAGNCINWVLGHIVIGSRHDAAADRGSAHHAHAMTRRLPTSAVRLR